MALVTKRVMNACQGEKAVYISYSIHTVVGDAAVLVAKVRTRWSASVYRGEWAYRTRCKAFKDKARLQLHSKNFSFKIVLFVRYCSIKPVYLKI